METTIDQGERELFADPKKLTRLPVPVLGATAWIEVRDEISVAEERRVFSKAVKGTTRTKDGEPRMEYDAEQVSFGNVVLHIVDWSLKTPYSADALKALKPNAYKAIDDVVQAHLSRVKEGNAPPPPASGASPTSASAG